MSLRETLSEVLTEHLRRHSLNPDYRFFLRPQLRDATLDSWMHNLTAAVYWAALTTQRIGAGMETLRMGNTVNISTQYAVLARSPHLYAGTNSINPPGCASTFRTSRALILNGGWTIV